MQISNATYFKNDVGSNASISVTINGKEYSVPLDPANSHYAEILRQVDAGDLTIADAPE